VHDQYLLDGVEVRMVLPKKTASVQGQPIRLEQVILNLLANARDAVLDPGREESAGETALPAGQQSVIEISAFLADMKGEHGELRRPDEVVIRISDNGGGLPEDVIDHVFEPFFTTKPAGQGTGLGLAIGYSIVSGMGGTISATNGLQGAFFEIRLPVSDVDVQAVEDANGNTAVGE